MKRFLCLMLSLFVFCGMFFEIDFSAYAEENNVSYISNDKMQEGECIYYTDLFYAYPKYLSEDKYFEIYSNNIESVYDTVNDAYQNSSLIVGTGLEHALATITSPTDMVKLITDTLGLTDFSYNDALDAANDEFVRNILSESTVHSVEKAFGKTANINDKFNKIVSYFNKLEFESANGCISYSAEYYVQKAFDYLHDEGVFSFVSEQTLAKLWVEINDRDFTLSDCFSLAKNEIDIAKALVTSIMLEDARLEIIAQIIATQKSDTILKQGMVRLKNQLDGNFTDYFIKSYLIDKLADKVFEEIDKIIMDVVTGDELFAIIEVVKNALDLVMDVPSYGDVLKWQVLICYSNDLASVIPEVANSFSQGSFLSDKILEYESMFTAYAAINRSAMASTERIADMLDPFGAAYEVLTEAIDNDIETVTIKSGLVAVPIPATTSSSELYEIMLGEKILTTSSGGIFTIGKKIEVSNGKTTVTIPIQANLLSSVMQGCISESQEAINNFNSSYANNSIYEEHIKNVKKIIFDTPIGERNIICNREYNLDGNTKLRIQSDVVEKNSIYTFNNSLLGNVNASGNVSITFPIEVFGNFYCSTSAKSNICITNCATLKISGNLEFCTQCPNWLYKGDSYIRVDEKSKIEVGGDFLLHGSDASGHGHYANLYINGTIIVDGNLTTNYSAYRIFSTSETGYFKIGKNVRLCVWSYADKNYGVFSAGTMEIGGNYEADTNSLKYTGSSVVVFSGIEEQNVANLITNNLIIKNKSGIKYLSNIYVNGLFDTENNPINNNGFYTVVSNTTRYLPEYNYYNIRLQSNIDLTQSVKATLFTNGHQLTIPEEGIVEIDGTVYVNASQLIVNGKLRVTGKIDVANKASVVNYGNTVTNSVYLQTMNYYAGCNSITNYGYFEVLSNFESCKDTYANGRTGYRIIQNASNAEFVVGGNFLAQTGDVCDSLTNGIVRFNGTSSQYVKNLKAPTIVIDNESASGVTFATNISPSVLFDHKGNKFALSGGGTFIDYDGDGKKDNVDPYPTVGNPCTITVKSEDVNKGTVSTDSFDTVGGTKISVTAMPTFKYQFSKWVNSYGNTISVLPEYTFVAKGDTSLTAVFVKRSQIIIKESSGGIINCPASAEIESEVIVTLTENDGYVYTEGTLAYNGITIEGNSFIMPDDTVTLTAEFVRNDHYFALNDVLATAKSYTYQSYSKESFDNLTAAINDAQKALVNNITAEESENHISMLQVAIDGLQEKHIATVALETIPTLYINVPDMINDILVLVTYDNGTTITVTGTECTIAGYDSTVFGEQSITVEYGGVSGVVKVEVQKRLMTQCIIDVNNQVYDGVKEQYTPTPIVSYARTGEMLKEDIDFTLEYRYHTEIGTAVVIVNGIGNYTGRRIGYFEIYCEHNYKCTERVESTCIQMGYQIEKCKICGETKTYTNMATEGLPESEHNYANNSDISYTYTDKGAHSLIIKFSSSTLTENSYDKIYIYDGKDTLLGTYTGSELSGKNIKLAGDTVRIRLVSDGSVVKYGFSLDSITAYFDRLMIPTSEHIYGEWSTVTAATPDAVGMKHKLCTECGDEITEEIPMVSKPAFRGASLSLHHNLAINYKVDKALFDKVGYAKPYVVFEIGGVKTTVEEYTIDNERYVFKFQNIAPNQMNDIIYATLYATYNGVEYASETREYSVAEYCYSMLDTYGADEYAELRTLLVDLLHYGAQSQLYTDYNTASLVDANLTDEQLLWGTNEEQTLTDALNTAYETVENPTAKWKGAGLTLTDSVSMRFKFTANNVEGLSVKIKGEMDEWIITSDKFVEEDGVYYVYFNGLNAGQMSEKVYLTIYDGDVAVSNTVCYSIESYAYEKQNSSIAYLSDLVKAMMKYGNSANAYVN